MPSEKKETSEITVLKCAKCGEEISGPNANSVKAAMDRHAKKKKKHGR